MYRFQYNNNRNSYISRLCTCINHRIHMHPTKERSLLRRRDRRTEKHQIYICLRILINSQRRGDVVLKVKQLSTFMKALN